MSDAEELVALVDADDRDIGVAPKLQAHREGRLHRAMSVIIVNRAGETLLQRRALAKYHSGGLWTNACCSHPRPGETPRAAATRRLREELGIACALSPLFTTLYRARVGDLIEHELVHVFGGRHDGPATPDPAEVAEIEWRGLDALADDIEARPERYTVWFAKYMREHRHSLDALAAAA